MAIGVLTIVLIRGGPVAVCLLGSRALRWIHKLLLAVGFGALLSLVLWVDHGRGALFAWLPLVFLYMAGAALALFWLSSLLPAGWIKNGAVLIPSLGLFVVLPVLVVPDRLLAIAVVVGWETALSAHSYCVDTADLPEGRSIKDYLFFLFVNPTFVWCESPPPSAPPSLSWRGLQRVALGMVALFAHSAAIALSTQWIPQEARLDDAANWVRGAYFLRAQVFAGLALYGAHSGLASVQIGFMRCLGYRLPERYHYPFLATSPQDFWRRWNSWVGRWAQRYLFRPISLPVARAWGTVPAFIAAVFGTFLIVGCLHDLPLWAVRLPRDGFGYPSLRMTLVFGIAALLLVVFAVLQRIFGMEKRALGRSASRVLCVVVLFAMTWLAAPVLKSNALPPSLERFVRSRPSMVFAASPPSRAGSP